MQTKAKQPVITQQCIPPLVGIVLHNNFGSLARDDGYNIILEYKGS